MAEANHQSYTDPTAINHSMHHSIPDSECLNAQLSNAEAQMFSKIISSGCTIKNQQRNEAEPTTQTLNEILHTLLLKKPSKFLMRFGSYLEESDLSFFEHLRDDFEVNYRIQKLQANLKQSSKVRIKKIRNRRYEYLKQELAETTYFSEEEMRQRNPLLFDYYIGQFLTEDEKHKMEGNNSDMTLSSMILKKMELDKRSQLLKLQKTEEQNQFEELDSSSDENEEHETSESQLAAMELSTDPKLANTEKFMLRREFLTAMQTNFLEGKDKDFDYSKIDFDERYDSLDMKEKDDQDDYFDTEEPSWCEVTEGDEDADSNANTN